MAMRMSDRERVQQLQRRLSKWNPDEKCQVHSWETCGMYDTQGKLIGLHLCGLGLKQVPSEVWQFSALQFLDLRNNQLSTLPEEVGNLTALRSLDLRNNQLSALPEEVGNLTALQSLDLSNNQLSALPEEVGSLTALRSLYLINNQLSALPEEVGSLTALHILDLPYNQLSALPKEVGSLTALQRLDLRNNQLSALPEEVGSLTALQSLDLSNNPWQIPIPYIITQGISAILEYLRSLPDDALDMYLASQPLPPYYQAVHTITVFYLYAHADTGFREELEKHVSGLRLQRLIADRHDGQVPVGADREQAVRGYLDTAQIVLLLVSPDFMASDFMASDDREVQRVMQRHARRETRVVPILLRPVDWTGVPFASLAHLPSTGEPITRWMNRDDAFLNVVQGLRTVIQEILSARFEGVQRDLQVLHDHIDDLKNPYTEVERSLERLSEVQDNLTEQCRTIEEEIATLQRRLQGLQQEVAIIPERRRRFEGERQEIRDEALEIRERESRLEQEAEALRGQIERVKHQ